LATVYYPEKWQTRNACDEAEVKADKALQKVIHNKDQGLGVMVYVEANGGCSAPVKVRNMEKAGA
jgi:hypothetical protein